MDPDPGPAIFVSDLQDYFLKVHLHNFLKIKISHKTVGINFSYYFCLMIEGSGSVSMTNGSGFGSGRPKKI